MCSAEATSGSAFRELGERIVQLALAGAPAPVVLIDGPSGAGKSTLADAVVEAWPFPTGAAGVELVRLDDLYPGWEGLERGSAQVHDDLLAPLQAGRPAGWRRWDWAASEPAEWHAVAPGHPLIVEGCGCLTRATAPLADVRVWLDAADGIRKSRALARDAGAFDAHWDLWQRQWARLVARESPGGLADIVVDTGLDAGIDGARRRSGPDRRSGGTFVQ